MSSPQSKGNNPQLWLKFLDALDEKLQLGLLNYLQRIAAYHFEEDVLYIEPGSAEDSDYLSRDSVLQHLQLLAQDAIKVERVKIKKLS
jgi:hypothetical protein